CVLIPTQRRSCHAAISHACPRIVACYFFFFNDPATTEIYTLSLHDALPISPQPLLRVALPLCVPGRRQHLDAHLLRPGVPPGRRDRKSTRLNSSHVAISYAVFCLKKKKT